MEIQGRREVIGKRYQGECECRVCGQGSATLVPTALPIVDAEFGKTIRLACDICGHRWLINPEAPAS